MRKYYDSEGNPVHIYNFTPHPVSLLLPGSGLMQIDPDGEAIRISMQVEPFTEFDLPSPVPILRETFANIQLPVGLQVPALVIVNRVVLTALHATGQWRKQALDGVLYVAPTSYVRDQLGRIAAASALTIS